MFLCLSYIEYLADSDRKNSMELNMKKVKNSVGTILLLRKFRSQLNTIGRCRNHSWNFLLSPTTPIVDLWG